jgi:hypothetical protein
MFLARYFMYVGGALLALLLVVSAELPQTQVAPGTNTASDMPTIRINSDRKWPAKVVFDTSAPTIVPIQTANNVAEPAAPPPAAPEVAAKAPSREAFAQLAPSDLKNSSVKKPEPKQHQRRKIARRHLGPPMGPHRMMVAQQPSFGFGFGFFGSRIW